MHVLIIFVIQDLSIRALVDQRSPDRGLRNLPPDLDTRVREDRKSLGPVPGPVPGLRSKGDPLQDQTLTSRRPRRILPSKFLIIFGMGFCFLGNGTAFK
jgi:hypothetical protein